MPDIERYTKEYLKHYGEQSFELHLITARRRQVLKSLRAHPHANILEVGCGLEPLFPHIGDYTTFTVIEPSAEFVERAKALSSGRQNVTVIQGRLEQTVLRPAEARTFDFIVLSSLLHEVPDPAHLLRAVHSISGPDTTTHINVPNVYSFHRLLALEMGLIDSVFDRSQTEARFQRYTRFDMPSLIRLVVDQGFRVISSGTYFVKPFTNEQMDQILRHGIVDTRVIQGLERMIRYLPEMGSEMYVEVRPA